MHSLVWPSADMSTCVEGLQVVPEHGEESRTALPVADELLAVEQCVEGGPELWVDAESSLESADGVEEA